MFTSSILNEPHVKIKSMLDVYITVNYFIGAVDTDSIEKNCTDKDQITMQRIQLALARICYIYDIILSYKMVALYFNIHSL